MFTVFAVAPVVQQGNKGIMNDHKNHTLSSNVYEILSKRINRHVVSFEKTSILMVLLELFIMLIIVVTVAYSW